MKILLHNEKTLALILILCIQSYSISVISQNIESKIDKLYEVNTNEPGFSIAVFKDDTIILEKQYGSAHLGYDIPITNETLFDVGSIGKQFTAAAILLLEEEGKLSIKDPVYKYIENFPRYKKGDPTIEHLLNQTSGIKEVDNYLEVVDVYYRDYISQSQLLNIITKVKELRFRPGEYFYYTNANYILLASIIEKTSGKSYNDYLQEAIFGPLKMNHTVVDITVSRTIKNRAIGYNEAEDGYDKTQLYSLKYVGDGQILTTPRDMFKWHQNFKKATIGTAELWRKMHTKAVLNNGTVINHGLGVEFETHNGYQAYGFDGMIKLGFVSKYLYFPELDIAFFTTQNTFDWDFKERFFELVDLYVKDKETAISNKPSDVAIELTNEQLKKYEGAYLFYQHDLNRKANLIRVINDQLKVLTLGGDEIAQLIPIGDHKFLFGEDGDAIVEFTFLGKQKQYTYDDFENEKPWVFKETTFYDHSQEELKEYEGEYFSKDFQVSRKLQLENRTLFYYYRNGAWKNEMGSLSKDVLEIPISPIEFIRNKANEIIGFTIMGIWFEKI